MSPQVEENSVIGVHQMDLNIEKGQTTMSILDISALGGYFLLMVCTGIYSMKKPNRDTLAGYFLAGRLMWWFPVGASLFASNIGSEHFIGLAGSGAASGIYVGAFELNALILLQVLGWIFLPVFIAAGVNTVPEYMNKRFGGRRIQTCLAILSVLLYILTKISVNLYSGAIFLQQAFQWTNLYLCVIILVGLTALLTIGGGLRAVMYTDTLQFFIMLVGSIYVAVRAFQEVGGYSNLLTEYIKAIPEKLVPNTTCGIPRTDSWVMLRNADPRKSDMPWPGFIFGQTPASIWYWCADQMMVQRVMAAKSLSHAQGGTIFAGFTKLLPLFMMVMPGMISRVLFPNEIGCADPVECQKFCGANTCTNFAYPKLVFSFMPNGMKGFMLAVMLSALISDLTSIFNSASTLFTMDIWTLARPAAKEREKIFVGRAFILILVVFSIMWIPIIEQNQGGELYIYIQAISAYLSPPIAAIYCLAILWKGINEPGAFYGLISGFGIGLLRMITDFYFKEPPCYEEDNRPYFIQYFHYTYFAMVLFWSTILVAVIVSKCTKPIEPWRLLRTTYYTRYDREMREDEIELKESLEQNGNIEIKDEVGLSLLGKLIKEKQKSEKEQREQIKMLEHLEKLTHLNQKKWEKWVLNILLLLIVVLAIVLYVYFSINPFSEEEILQMQMEKVEQLQGSFLSNNSHQNGSFLF